MTVPISSIGLRATAGNGQLTLNWNAPTNIGGAAIIRYEYRYRAEGEEWSDWKNAAARARGATVENLINGREYVFEARAVNALGKGSAETAVATPTVVTRPPPRPSRVAEVVVGAEVAAGLPGPRPIPGPFRRRAATGR